MKLKKSAISLLVLFFTHTVYAQPYKVVDTGQTAYYDDSSEIAVPAVGEPFYGQDAQYDGYQPSYTDNGDGTVIDDNTNLMWQKAASEKMTFDEALAGADTFSLADYDDWRLPTIKELYSLILFSGVDPSGWQGSDTNLLTPFIDTTYFEFEYGDESAGERIIDAQYWSSTVYVSTTMNGDETAFGVNFADGRIKGYPAEPVGPPGQEFIMTSFVKYVRNGSEYGVNDFIDNNDGTITDNATGLMWQQNDSETGLNWEGALNWVTQKNTENYLGYNDWRLPNAKEIQSIVDYTRSPATTNSAAIDSLFTCSVITDESGDDNYPFYWTGTTHANMQVNGKYAVYVSFGEALGWMEMPPNSGNFQLLDVHGAGAQRSDPKSGDPGDWPYGHGPQGDVIRIYNYARLVRDSQSTVGVIDRDRNAELPHGFSINSAYPNPFNPITTLRYDLPEQSLVNITIYDLLGREIRTLVNTTQDAGFKSVLWNATNDYGKPVSAGVYLYQIQAGEFVQTKKMVLLK
jgi:hypothetical protein